MNTYVPRGSHRIVEKDGRVVIRDLELFVGYDPDFDKKGSRVEKYDDDAVNSIVNRTRQYMGRGQYSKLILHHNSESDKGSEVVGEIVAIRACKIGNATGIVGDVEMSREDFEFYIASNRFPRRSAEIYPDGHMAQVALLNGKAPARPLPDTKFDHDDEPEVFERKATRDSFPILNEGGDMTDREKQLEAKVTELTEELEKTRADLNEKSGLVEQFNKDATDASKRADELAAEVKEMREEFAKTKVNSLIDGAIRDGFDLANDREDLFEKLVKADDPEADLAFILKYARKLPTGQRIDQTDAVAGEKSDAQEHAIQAKAAEYARDKCMKDGNADNYRKYFEEGLEQFTKSAA